MKGRNLQNITCGAYTQKVTASFSYEVCFTRGVFEIDNPVLLQMMCESKEAPSKAIVYLDAGLAQCHPYLFGSIESYFSRHNEDFELVASPKTLPGGERIKEGWDVAHGIIQDILKHRLCRHSFVIAAGGGAFLDVVGLGAALSHRGVRLVRLPSTTLAQGDAGVGIKNGINHGNLKNAVGMFAAPFGVVNDYSFLKTLPQNIMLDGIAEAFKVAILKDKETFEYLKNAAPRFQEGDFSFIESAVERSAMLHLDHIREGDDPYECGTARPLDFGHWSAHRLEGLSNYEVRHGEAVAIGIALDSYYAYRKNLLSRYDMEMIHGAFVGAGLPIFHPLLMARNESGALTILEGLEQFREHIGGKLSITLPGSIGSYVEVHEMDRNVIEEGVEFLSRYRK